jgi:YfiH family protein
MSSLTTDAGQMVERDGIEVLDWTSLTGSHPVDAIVTTRHGGVSQGPYATLNLGFHVGDDADAVRENRRRAARAVGLDLDDLVFANQTHGREVAVVDESHRGRGATSVDDAIDRVDGAESVDPAGAVGADGRSAGGAGGVDDHAGSAGGVDGLVTASPGIGLVVMVADCVPIVLYDPVAHVLACVHAGWRGTAQLVAEAAVTAMTAHGARPADILAGLGPCIEADRYQVGDEVAEAVRDAFGPAADLVVRPDGTGRWLFDLWAANRHTLLEAGLRPEHITVAPAGTGDDRWFSDRAERPCGRFAAIAALRPRPSTAGPA